MRRIGIMTVNDQENVVSCIKILSKYFDSKKYLEPASLRWPMDEYLNAWHLLKDTLTNMAAEEIADDYDIDEGDIVMVEDEIEVNNCNNCKYWNKLGMDEPCIDCDEEETNMKNEKVGINSPWITYVNQVKCLFADDTDVLVEYNDDKKNLVLKVFDSHRADALTQLLPIRKDFGGVILHISVVTENKVEPSFSELVEKAMNGNPHFSQLIKVPMQDGKSFSYLMFEPEVAQYWNDNLADPNGNVSTVFADLAQDVFGVVPGTFFATDC